MRTRFKSKLVRSIAVATLAGTTAWSAWATNPRQLLEEYRALAKKESPGFKDFSAERGKSLYLAERVKSNGERMSCTTCHSANPKSLGKTRAGKQIEPMAALANPERFTDQAKVEKWFKRNCKDVLERECTAQEKGDFISYMLSIQ